MNYQFMRSVPNPPQPPRSNKASYQHGFQPQAQQYYYPQPSNQYIQVPPMNGYQMMAFIQQQGQQQPSTFIPEDNYNQIAHLGMQNVQQTIRYPQSVSQYQDSRRKKKETHVQQYQPISTQPISMSPQLTSKRNLQQTITQPTIIQTSQIQTVKTIPQQFQTVPQQQTNMDQISQKQPVSNLFQFVKPPGCFNIISRGNLPGMIFQNVL